MPREPINFLRMYRKRSPLTQADIAFLMGLTDYSNISRCEKGQRAPSIELLLVYHLLFDTSIESFFDHHSVNARADLVNRIQGLIANLKKEQSDPKSAVRVRFLEEVITRITT